MKMKVFSPKPACLRATIFILLNIGSICALASGTGVKPADCAPVSGTPCRSLPIWYYDWDGDGYGDPNDWIEDPEQPWGYVANNTDCDDADYFINPGATEICDGLDNDCDGQVDEGLLITYYYDSDGDGYGDPNNSVVECTLPYGYVTNNTDCDDNAPHNFPNNPEICDGWDNDCDGQVDEGLSQNWYADNDGDSYGDFNDMVQDCQQPWGYVANSTDCNDSDNAIYPGATEICNYLDDDCDGETDEGLLLNWYADNDGDNFGDAGFLLQDCYQPWGYVANNTDCDDSNSSINPGATEICNYMDDDCDGQIDEGLSQNWYADNDGDSYGNLNDVVQDCQQPGGYVANSTDCDDSENAIHPGATEICNYADDDCNGQVDEGFITDWYPDNDGDGYGDQDNGIYDCVQPSGYIANGGDCNDNDPAVQTPQGNPAVFGNNVWNVYAWNAGNAASSGGASWNTNYSGYYIESDLNFNTEAKWSAATSPSNATGYTGCVVANDYHSWSAKRRGFPCGNYQLNVPGHDDEAQLWINGVMVWSHVGCCDAHTNVWSGWLGSNDQVEFRVTEGGGGSHGRLTFVNQNTNNGDPGLFGANVWNVYAWNAGGAASSGGSSWNTNYSGFYTDNNLNINTTNRWDQIHSPSWASGYTGCAVATDYHSWSAKRKGFPCGVYQINVPGHDDEAQLWINGVMVWNHVGCCDAHTNVWTGLLSSNDEVIFRVTEGAGAGYGVLSFTDVTPVLYVDADGDGYGTGQPVCAAPGPGYAAQAGDCNDSQSAVHPGATEVCNGIDDDCDGLLNESPAVPPAAPPVTNNNGLNFDGAEDYVEISACGAATPFINGGNAITIEYWFKGTNNHSAVRLQPYGGDYIVAGWNEMHILSNDGGISGIAVGGAVNDGNWHHVAMTWQRNTAYGFKSYLDGYIVDQRNSSNNPLPVIATGLYLGGWGTIEQMTGTLDEVRIWNVARTQAEIQAAMYDPNPAQTGLLAYFKFDHGTAGGNNAGIAAVANTANANAFTGELKNFALNGTVSNWAPPAPSAPLPVELLFFQASPEDGKAKLTWATASEREADRFEVEHSTDGFSFAKTGEVKARGNTNGESNYSFRHDRPANGENYYRLRQVDLDGQFEYSHIVSVEMEHKGSGLHFFPNPAAGAVTLTLETSHSRETMITLYDLSGKQMKTQTLLPAGDVFQTTVDLSGLPGGVYLLEVWAGQEQWRERLVVIQSE